ncbi:MAG: hypothetical protein HEP71_28655 [Roseivirga sp.]|nr:hypothetical protein [Roseivirga sp.]
MIRKIAKRLLNHKQREDKVFNFTITEMVNMYKNNQKTIEKWTGEIISDEILKHKKSDTIFILGSGPSINRITDEQWKHIGQHDSFGFNYWFLHDFIPTFYMFQMPEDEETQNMTLNILEGRQPRMKDVPFILRGSAIANGKLDVTDKRFGVLKDSEVYFLNEYPLHMMVETDINLVLEYLDLLDLLPHGNLTKFIPKLRSSMALLIVLAYQMGYENIVLCGMDMQGGFDHFWDDPKFEEVYNKYQLGVKEENEPVGFELFTETKFSKNTVPEYVYHLKDWMKKKSNVEVSVVNDGTILYPKLPVYKKF